MMTTIIPLVYGLLIGKNADEYSSFFKIVLDHDDFHPETILTDFKTGTVKAAKDMLPNVTRNGRKRDINTLYQLTLS